MPDTQIISTLPTIRDSGVAARVARLENDIADVKWLLGQMVPMVARLDVALSAALPQLANPAAVADFRMELKGELADLLCDIRDDWAGLREDLSAFRRQTRPRPARPAADAA